MTTTTNGGSLDKSRIAEHVQGIVQGANDRGVHLQGEADWRNYSRWADKPAEAPARGATVRLAIDASGFVWSVDAEWRRLTNVCRVTAGHPKTHE
jgi:hypothetical protein